MKISDVKSSNGDMRPAISGAPVVDVYIAELPKDEPIGMLECRARADEIASVRNEKVKREKYFVWKLLCYALEHSFSLAAEKLDFKKESFGGWSVSDAVFSISHSEKALAVAVSRDAVGIDIERVHTPRSEKMSRYIMSDAELTAFLSLPDREQKERLIEIWTAKEAVFKSKREESFIPSKIDLSTASFKSGGVSLDGEQYIWSVATATPERIRVFDNIDLTKIK